MDPIHFMFHFPHCIPKSVLTCLLLLFIIGVEQWLTAIYSIIMWNKRKKCCHFSKEQNKCVVRCTPGHRTALTRCLKFSIAKLNLRSSQQHHKTCKLKSISECGNCCVNVAHPLPSPLRLYKYQKSSLSCREKKELGVSSNPQS